MSRKIIQLNGGPPWGFRMYGGKDTTSSLKIVRVNPESKAERNGIREGDLVDRINGDNVENLTSGEAQKLVKKSGSSISLELKSAKRVNVSESAGNQSGETSSSLSPPNSSSTTVLPEQVASNSIHDIHLTTTTTPASSSTTTITNTPEKEKSSRKSGKEKKSKKKTSEEKLKGKVVEEPQAAEQTLSLQITEDENKVYEITIPNAGVSNTNATDSSTREGNKLSECECIFHKEGMYAEGHILNKNSNEDSIKNKKTSSEMVGGYGRGRETFSTTKAKGVGDDLLGEIIAELDGFLDTSFFDEDAYRNSQGVWSPGSQNDTSSPATKEPVNGNCTKEEPIVPVWTPTTAPSPSAERKFRPVNFNVPDSPRSISLERASSPPKREIVRSASWNQSQSQSVYSPQGPPNSQPPSLQNTPPEQPPFSASQLPKYQNPTITLLQKAREGQLPKGAHYLDHKTPPLVRSTSASGIPPQTRAGSFPSRQPTSFTQNLNDTLYEVRIEEGKPTGRRLEFTPRKFNGIGPTTPDGVPLALRSGIKGEQQHEHYKRWYQSLHVDKPQRSAGRPLYGVPATGSYSEPEGYESDSYAYKYATLDRRKFRDRQFEADYFSPEPFSPTLSSVPGIRFQPGRIEDYTPGAASAAPKSIHRHKPQPHWGIGRDLGYESDSNLVIRKREEAQDTPPPPPLSPSEQRQVYVDIQKGGEVPLQGLRKPAPDKTQASFFRRVIMPTFEEFKRGLSPKSREGGTDSPRSVRSGSPALMKARSTVSLLQDRIQAKLSRSKSDLNPSAPKLIGGKNKISNSRPASSLSTSPSKLLLTSRTTTQLRRNGSTSGIPVRTLSRDTSFEKLGLRSPELTSPREVKKAMETSHKLTIRLEVEKPNASAGKSNGISTMRKSGLKKTPGKNGKPASTTAVSTKSVKITIDENGIPTKPPRKTLLESGNQSQASVKGKFIPKVTKVTQVASRHAGCLSPHHSRPTSPSSALSKSTSLSNLQRGSSYTNLQSTASGSSHTLRVAGKPSLTLSEGQGNMAAKLDPNRKKTLPISATSGGGVASGQKSRTSSAKKLIREMGDGAASEKKTNRLTNPDPKRKSNKSDTDSGIGLGEKGQQQSKLKKLEGRNEEDSLCLIANPVVKPEVRVAQQKKTNLCSSTLSPSPGPANVASAYFTIPGRRKGFHSRDYCCYDLLSSLDDSSFRSLPALTPYLKETKRVSNSSFVVRNGNRSISPIPRPTLTSFLRERIGMESRAGVKRSSSLQSLRGKREYSSYVLELQHARKKSPRFVQLHRLYSSLERLGQLEKSTSMYDIPILSLEKQVDFDAWWKVRKRIRVDAEIESISSELSHAQKNREFFFRPRKTEDFRWKGDSALRIKKWTTDELRGFLLEWLKKSDGYKSAYDLHKTAWRGTSVKEVALNMEVASLAKSRNEYYQEGSLGRFGWLRRAFSMSSTLSEEQRTNIKQRLGTLIKRNASKTTPDAQSKESKAIQGRPIMTSRMGSTSSSALYRTDSGRIIGADGSLTESAKQQLSRTLSQEIRERRALNSAAARSLKSSSEGDGEMSDHSGKTVIHVPITTQVLLNRNKYKDTCTKNKVPAYSMYCNNGVPSKVSFFETYSKSEESNSPAGGRGKENIIRPSRTTVTFSEIEKPKSAGGLYRASSKGSVYSTLASENIKNARQSSPVFTRRSRSASPTWRTSPGCSDDKHSYMSHVNVISKLAALILKRDGSLKHLIRREILEHEKLERLRLANEGEVDRLKYHFENYYPKDYSGIQKEVNLLRCLFCSDPDLARLTNCTSPHRRCVSADIFKEKLLDLCDRAPDGREASPSMSMSPDLYFNSRSRKPIYQPSSTPNVCQPTLTAHCYLESPTKSMTEYSDMSGGIWDYFSDSPNTVSLSPTPSSNPALPLPKRNWNYDPSIHQPKYRYIPVQPQLPPPPIPPPPRPSGKNELTSIPASVPQLYRSVRHWIPGSRKELGAFHHGVVPPPRRQTYDDNPPPTPFGGTNAYNDNYIIRNKESPYSPGSNKMRTQDEIESQMRIIQAELESQRRALSPNATSYSALASPLPVSPTKYSESEVNIHYRAPVRLEEKEYIGEGELRRRQQAAMKKFYEDQRHRKFMQEIQDIENRRHMDNFTPSQKSPIPMNRYEDVFDEPTTPKWRERTPEQRPAARALHNFVAQNARELNFRKGDILFLRRKLDANWYEGEHNAAVGIFPASYVEIIQSHNADRATPKLPSEGQAKVLYNFTAASPAEISIAKGETIVLTRRVDSNWFEGRIGQRSGIFPVSYVQVLKEPGSNLGSSLSPKPIGSPAARTLIPQNGGGGHYQAAQHGYRPNQYSITPDLGNIQNSNPRHAPPNGHGRTYGQDLTIDTRNDPLSYRAIYNYPPAHDDELELRENDIIHVLEKCSDGWFVGVSLRTSKWGIFPGNYVERVY